MSRGSTIQNDARDTEDELRTARVRVKNRRKRYLDLHPDYFTDASREIAEPLLYDRLVRRFMTAEERQTQNRVRGFAGVLEADMTRSEAKLDAIDHPDPNHLLTYQRADDGSIIDVEKNIEDRVKSKEEGWQKWIEAVSSIFITGKDEDFEYGNVDENEDYDDLEEEERTRLEQYVAAEEEHFDGEGSPQGETGIQDY